MVVLATLGLPFSNAQELSNVIVTAYWQSNGATNISISSNEKLAVVCTQASTVTSSATITLSVEGANAPASINPDTDTVTLAPDATQTIYFDVSNTGGFTATNGVTILIVATDPNTGVETSNCTVTADFPATLQSTASPTATPTQTPMTAGANGTLIIEVIALVAFLAFLSVIAVTYVRRKNNRTFPPPP